MNTRSNVDDDDDDNMLDVDDNQINANVGQDHQDVSSFEFESEVEVENTLTDFVLRGSVWMLPRDRESNRKFQELNVAEIRQKVNAFTHATLDSTIILKAMDTRANLLDSIQAVNSRIVGSEAAREIAQVRVFAYLYHMHINIESARQQPDFKGFLMELRTLVGLKSSPAVSKFQRRCKRVAELVDVVGNQAGASVLGLYSTIYSLENDMEEAWKLLLKDIKAQRQFLEFTKSLQLASDQVTPILARNEQ